MKKFIVFIILSAASLFTLAQAPIAVEDEIFTFDNETATGSLATNDINPSGLPLTYTLLSSINYGTLTLQQNGSWTFIPGPTTSALNDIIYYQVCNSAGQCNTGTIYLYVQFHNNIPEANNDLFYVEMNSVLSANVGTNDYDADYLTDPISTQNNFSATSLPATGTLNLSLNGSFTYTPPAGYTGTVTFNYLNCDACTTCDNATVTIQVIPANGNPTANASSINATEDMPFTGNLASLTSDPENDNLTYAAANQPLHGSLVVQTNGSYTYVPYSNYFGSDVFTYQACDIVNQCATATITVVVANTNDAPSLTNDSFTLFEDQQGFSGSANANDTDDFSTISYSIVSNTSNGQLNLSTTGNFTYTPNTNFNGLDNATIQGCDAQGLCSTSNLFFSVNPVNDAPNAVLDDLYGYEDTPLSGSLANDFDVDGDFLNYSLLTPPASGNLIIYSNGNFTYLPASNFAGFLSATYVVCDSNGGCSNGTLQIEIIEINDDPIIVSDLFIGQEDQSISGNIRTNDTEPDLEAISYTVTSGAANGTLILNSNGTFTYTPNAQWFGTEVISYIGCDPCAVCLPGTLTIQVNPVNDAPSAGNGTATANEDQSTTGSLLPLVSDIDNSTFSFSLLNPANQGTVTVSSQGNFTYVPAPNYFGSDSFTYQVCDAGGLCSTGSMAITIIPINDPPAPIADQFSVNEDFTLNGTVANDTDPENQPLTYSLISSSSNGSFNLLSNGTFTWTPQANYAGSVTLAYQVCDNAGGCANSTVTIITNPVNDAPVATDDTESAYQNATSNGTVAVNDYDIDSPILIYSMITNPAHGSWILSSNGTFTYTPTTNFAGSDQATYTVCDNQGACDVGLVQWTVYPTNSPPVANDAVLSTNEDTPIAYNLGGLVTDLEGGVLNYALIIPNAQAVNTSISALGMLTFIPNAESFGSMPITYRVCDSGGLCDTAQVIVSVAPVNDAPVFALSAMEFEMNEDLMLSAPIVASDAEGAMMSFSLINAPAGMTISTNGLLTFFAGANAFGNYNANVQVCDPIGLCTMGSIVVHVLPINDSPTAQDDAETGQEDNLLSGTVAENDSDIDSNTLHYSMLMAPQHGILVLQQNGSFSYQPDQNYFGSDSFSYVVCDDSLACDQASVNVTVLSVQDAPIAQNDFLTINEDTEGQLQLGNNDADQDGDILMYSTAESSGTLGLYNLNTTGEFALSAMDNAYGMDTLVITIQDGTGLSTTSLLFLEVTPVNDAPIAAADAYTTLEETSIQGSVIDNDIDVDDGMLVVEFLDAPALGSLTDNQLGWFSYVPNPMTNGTEIIAYRICDAENACDTSTLSITILPVNNPPYVAGEYTHVMEDTFGEGNVSVNDQDPDQELLLYSLIAAPYHGAFTLDSTGQYTYTPTPNYSGLDSAFYAACDAGGLCASAWIIFEVDFINDAPIVQDEAVQVFMNGSIAGSVATNDIELDNEVLTYYVLQDFTFGIFYMAPDGSYTFTPNPDITGTFTVNYYGCDPCSICDDGTLTILVVTDKDANTTPVTLPIETSICEGDYLEINMNEYVDDAQTNDALLTFSFEGVNSGLISFDEISHVLTYQSMPGVLGSAAIPYTVCDDGLVTMCTSDTLTIHLNNHLPVNITDANVTPPSCFGTTDGQITIESLNIAGTWSFNWSTNETTNSISNLGAGNYSLSIQSDLACAIPLDTIFILADPEVLEITNFALSGITSTSTGSIVAEVIGGHQPYTYLWTLPNGSTSPNVELLDLTQPGSYELLVTDGNGCTVQASTTLTSIMETMQTSPTIFWSSSQESLIIQNCEWGSLRLYNVSGSLCLEQPICGGKPIRLNGLAAGLYHWQIADDHSTWNGRFMKH